MYILKMLMPVDRLILIVNVVLTLAGFVNSLKCFECTLSEAGCVDPTLNNVSIVDCRHSIFTLNVDKLQARMRGTEGDDDFRCLTTIEINSTEKFYTRRCALPTENLLCSLNSRQNSDLEFEKCVLCQKDFCNSSSVHYVNVYFIYLLLGFTLFVKINYL